MNKKLKLEELGRLDPDSYGAASKWGMVVVLDNIRSMNNIGSIFRTCDAFRVSKVMLCGITAQPPHRDMEKTALGATDTVEWEHWESTVECVVHLQEHGFSILSLEQTSDSISLEEFVPDSGRKHALVFGHEVNGVQDEVVRMSDVCLEIPQYGTKHSLNVAVSAGMAIWDIFSKTKKALHAEPFDDGL